MRGCWGVWRRTASRDGVILSKSSRIQIVSPRYEKGIAHSMRGVGYLPLPLPPPTSRSLLSPLPPHVSPSPSLLLPATPLSLSLSYPKANPGSSNSLQTPKVRCSVAACTPCNTFYSILFPSNTLAPPRESSPLTWPVAARSSRLISEGRGNFGAGPKPPSFLSKPLASEAAQPDTAAASCWGVMVLLLPSAAAAAAVESDAVNSCSCCITVLPCNTHKTHTWWHRVQRREGRGDGVCVAVEVVVGWGL